MKRFFRLFLLLAFSLVVQIGPGPSDWGLDLPILFVALVGVQSTLLEAAAWGALAGLFQDLLSACGPGPYLAAKTLAAVAAYYSQRFVYRERVPTQALMVGLCMALQQGLLWFFFVETGGAPPFPQALGFFTRSVVLTTLAGAVVVAWIVRYRRQYNDPATA